MHFGFSYLLGKSYNKSESKTALLSIIKIALIYFSWYKKTSSLEITKKRPRYYSPF